MISYIKNYDIAYDIIYDGNLGRGGAGALAAWAAAGSPSGGLVH